MVLKEHGYEIILKFDQPKRTHTLRTKIIVRKKSKPHSWIFKKFDDQFLLKLKKRLNEQSLIKKSFSHLNSVFRNEDGDSFISKNQSHGRETLFF